MSWVYLSDIYWLNKWNDINCESKYLYLIVCNIVTSNFHWFAMVVNFSLFIYPVHVNPRVEKDFCKGNQLGKNQPNVNHLDVGSGGKALRNTDEERGEDKEGGEVDSDDSFKEEVLEEVCSIDNDKDKYGW